MRAHVFEVKFQGRLGQAVLGALDGFRVETDDQGVTSVVGPIPDQAALLGMLDMLGDLNIEVISVNPVDAAR